MTRETENPATPPAASLIDAWTHTVRANPSARVLIDAASAREWSRGEIDALAEAWGETHRATAVRQVVAFAEPNGAGWLQVFLGLLKSDAVIIPVEPGEPIEAQRAMARHVGAGLLWREGRLEVLGPSRRPRADGRRLIKLTSGTTGAPRSVMFTDAEMMADGRHVSAAMGIRADDINLGLIPWGHSYGLGNLVMPLVLQGTAIVYGSAPLPHAIAAAVERWSPTVFPAVPALLRALAESTVTARQLASFRTVISAGAPLAPEVAQSFHARIGRKIHGFYGSSETGGICYDPTGDSAALGRGVGLPLPGVQLEIGRGRRLTVRSAAVFTLRNPHPGSHRMADLAQLDGNGELVLLGRTGRFVKIGGRRLNLAEVERSLKTIPGVRDALVASHAERTDALAAAVVSDLPGRVIREALRERLAPWKIPRKILTLAAFPLTSRGKTDTRQVRALLDSGGGIVQS